MSSWDSCRPANHTAGPSCRAFYCQRACFQTYTGWRHSQLSAVNTNHWQFISNIILTLLCPPAWWSFFTDFYIQNVFCMKTRCVTHQQPLCEIMYVVSRSLYTLDSLSHWTHHIKYFLFACFFMLFAQDSSEPLTLALFSVWVCTCQRIKRA